MNTKLETTDRENEANPSNCNRKSERIEMIQKWMAIVLIIVKAAIAVYRVSGECEGGGEPKTFKNLGDP